MNKPHTAKETTQEVQAPKFFVPGVGEIDVNEIEEVEKQVTKLKKQEVGDVSS